MDTKPLEIESESYIQHELIKFGFKVTKPTFDTDGTDLLIIDNIKDKYTHFLKIQCKGRTLKSNRSHIEIPKEYVTDNFIVFLYIRNEKHENFLFAFFCEDIIQWNIRDNKYFLSFSSAKLNTSQFLDKEFRSDTVEIIQKKLKSSKNNYYSWKKNKKISWKLKFASIRTQISSLKNVPLAVAKKLNAKRIKCEQFKTLARRRSVGG